MLSLMHLHLATSPGPYKATAFYLLKSLLRFPELPVIKVRPRDFYGSPSSYVRDQIRLAKYLRENPDDAPAQLVLAYLMYRDGESEKAKAALSKVITHSRSRDLTEAARILWDGMVASGQASGTLESGPARDGE
jgi:hypothetical protein